MILIYWTAGAARRRTRPRRRRRRRKRRRRRPSPSEDSSDSEEEAPVVKKPETEEERAAAKLRVLVELYAKSPDRPLSAADADELNQLREKTCGSEGAAKDRQAAKRLLRKRYEAAQPEAP